MNANGYKLKSDSELTEYQKRIDSIDNVILCMAEAEKMVSEIGRSLLEVKEFPGAGITVVRKARTFLWSGRKVSFR